MPFMKSTDKNEKRSRHGRKDANEAISLRDVGTRRVDARAVLWVAMYFEFYTKY